MHKLEKPLYHGTASATADLILIYGFNAPIYLTESKEAAVHYARAAAAYTEYWAGKEGVELTKEQKGYAIFTFLSVPNQNALEIDDYNLAAEKGQWIYAKRIFGLEHFKVERHRLVADDEERLRLCCFAIGMWRKEES